jgi:hypothetical protein
LVVTVVDYDCSAAQSHVGGVSYSVVFVWCCELEEFVGDAILRVVPLPYVSLKISFREKRAPTFHSVLVSAGFYIANDSSPRMASAIITEG